MFPSSAGIEYDYSSYLVELASIDISLPKFTIVPGKGPFTFPTYDCLRPSLRTQMPPMKPTTQLETLLGFQKRNGNVAGLHSGMNPQVLAAQAYDHFIKSAVEPRNMHVFDGFNASPLELSAEDFDEWVKTQDHPDIVRKLSYSDLPIPERLTSLFNFQIKNSVKPAMQDADFNKVASVQTIAAAVKSVNALFCSLFVKMKKRWLSVMKDKYIYNTDLSVEHFEKKLNQRFSSIEYIKSARVENDISKYDKSMRAWSLLFEVKLYKALGLPDYLALIWYNSHVVSRYLDPVNGFSASFEYQRRSGDASTFFGNSLVKKN